MADLGYWARTGRTRRGIASRPVQLMARLAFERIELVRVEIVVAVDNRASLRVAEKVGATREGVLRNRMPVRDHIHDAVMHSLIPQDFKDG
jgi:RimJ/RimL family protein N-acetyltransferase